MAGPLDAKAYEAAAELDEGEPINYERCVEIISAGKRRLIAAHSNNSNRTTMQTQEYEQSVYFSFTKLKEWLNGQDAVGLRLYFAEYPEAYVGDRDPVTGTDHNYNRSTLVVRAMIDDGNGKPIKVPLEPGQNNNVIGFNVGSICPPGCKDAPF